MSQRVSVFAILAICWVVACGSDPAPAPASPSSGAQGTIAPLDGPTQPAPQDRPTGPAPLGAGTSTSDIVACLGNIHSAVSDACKTCVATSCREPITTVGAACPDFSKCVCDGNSMTECAPKLMAAGCGQAGMAVGTCVRQSCAAQCPPPGGAAGTPPGAAPAATSGDVCTDLAACCAQLPGAPPGCAKMATSKNAQACTSLLAALHSMNKCQ